MATLEEKIMARTVAVARTVLYRRISGLKQIIDSAQRVLNSDPRGLRKA